MSNNKPGLLLALGAFGLAAFIFLYNTANPSANIQLTLSKSEVEQRAQQFLTGRGLKTDGAIHAIVFGSDDMAAIFLQKSVGLDKTNEVSDPGQPVYVPLWRWGVRFFRPQEKEEFEVSMTPNGKITGFEHVIPEDREGANLDQAAAESIALDFLEHPIAQADALLPMAVAFLPADWERVTASSQKLKARTDHYFTWKRKEPRFGDGDLRLRVTIAGDQMAAYHYFLKVPEDFEQKFRLESDLGDNIARGALILTLVLFILAITYFMVLLRKGDMDFRVALLTAGFVSLGAFLGVINSWPGALYGYSTHRLFVGEIFGLIIAAVLGGLGIGGLMLVMTGVGSALLTRDEKQRLLGGLHEIACGKVLTPALARAAFYGYLIAFFFLGYDTILYAVVRHLGWVWFPAGNEFTEAYASLVPALVPLSISITAGFWEEGFFRFASFATLRKFLKWAPAAALIPTLIWAFAHSNYPVFPVYFRGIELTIGGLLFFYFFWRYGFLTVAFAHFFIDTILIAMPLLKAPSPYFKISGMIAMAIGLIPMAMGLIGRGRKVYLVPDVPRLDADTSLILLRRAFNAGTLPVDYIRDILRIKGLDAAPPEERVIFLAREIFALPVTVSVEPGAVTLRIHGGAPKVDAFRELLAIDPALDPPGLLLQIPP
ncbi:MAG: CPBP family intramembrane glutamic endopeptidase [bacterium]